LTDVLSPEQLQMLEQARDLIDSCSERGITLRALGGIGIACQCPSALRPPLARTWKDVDFISLSSQRRELEDHLQTGGLTADVQFNALHGRHRLNFVHADEGYDVDVFLDRLVMCHTLDVSDRLALHERTLDPADLLLSKLQVVETNERDFLDVAALLTDHSVDRERIVSLLCRDWGWWRTATEALDRSAEYIASLQGFDARDKVLRELSELQREIEAAPKSRGWKMRARIGERVRWYELPEEDDAGI
jgi:hypothetical protein